MNPSPFEVSLATRYPRAGKSRIVDLADIAARAPRVLDDQRRSNIAVALGVPIETVRIAGHDIALPS